MSFSTKGDDAGQRLTDKPTEERDPPHSIEAEQALLGAILIYPPALGEVVGVVEAHHFFEPLHGQIFERAMELTAQGKVATPITLKPYFQGEPPVNDFTVAQYLGRLAAAATSILAIKSYAETVRDHALRREAIVTGEALSARAQDLTQEIIDTASDAISKLTGVITNKTGSKNSIILVKDAAAELVNELRSGMKPKYVSSGLADLDLRLGGGYPADYIIIGARPSMGKTTLGTESAVNIAKSGKAVLFFSLEMQYRPIVARMLSSLLYGNAPIPYSRIMSHKLNPGELVRITSIKPKFDALPIAIEPTGGLTVAQIRAKTKILISQFERQGVEPGAILVDHLGKIKPAGQFQGNKVHQTGEVSADLANLQKEVGLPLIALCQLNRASEQKDNKVPDLADLRNSGDIEQDADTVILLHRKAYYLQRKKCDGEAAEAERKDELKKTEHDMTLILAKNRNGPSDHVNVFVSMESSAIRNAEKRGATNFVYSSYQRDEPESENNDDAF